MAAATTNSVLRFPFLSGMELRLRPGMDISQKSGFEALCADNPDLRIERNRRGELAIEMPTKGVTGARNLRLSLLLGLWALTDGTGIAFDSSAGFELPDGSTLSPDAAWIRRDRLETLTDNQKKSFLPLAPDFIVELRSDSDRLTPLQQKMTDWIASGVRLALLLDPMNRCVHLYRPGSEPQLLHDPPSVDCSPELSRFVLEVSAIFDLTL
jgi:Uma2 family endonuclease